MLRVNGDFLGCLVGPGKQTVTLEFRPGEPAPRLARLSRRTGTDRVLPGLRAGAFPAATAGGRHPMSYDSFAERLVPEGMTISVVLPVYNEARVLPELLRRVGDALAACAADYEIIFVDDGSTRPESARAGPVGRGRPPRPRHPPVAQLRPPGRRPGRIGPQPRRRRRADGFRFAGRPGGHRAVYRQMAGGLRRGLRHSHRAQGKPAETACSSAPSIG